MFESSDDAAPEGAAPDAPNAESAASPPHSPYMVEVRDVHKFFGDIHVLAGVSLNVEYGEVCTILGPSGSWAIASTGRAGSTTCGRRIWHASAPLSAWCSSASTSSRT